MRAEETIRWTPEAEARMTRVPAQVKGIARTGVLRLALEKGHCVITSAVLDEAMDRFMPKSAVERDQGAGRGRGARAREGRPRVDVPGVRRRGHASRRRSSARSAAPPTSR